MEVLEYSQSKIYFKHSRWEKKHIQEYMNGPITLATL